MMKPVAHNETAASAKGAAVLQGQGQGKAGQGSLFATLMSVLGKKSDSATAAKGDGKGAVIVDAKALSAQKSAKHVATQSVKLAGEKIIQGSGKQASKKDQEKKSKESEQVAALLPQHVQPEAATAAKNGKSRVAEASVSGDKGAHSSSHAGLTGSAFGKQIASQVQQLQGGKAAAGKDALAQQQSQDGKALTGQDALVQQLQDGNVVAGKDHVAAMDEAVAKTGQSGKSIASKNAASQKADASKHGVAEQVDKANISASHSRPQSAQIASSPAHHSAQAAQDVAAAGIEAHPRDTTDTGKVADTKGKSDSKVAAEVAQGSHPSNALAMKQAEAEAAGKQSQAHTKFEMASAKEKKQQEKGGAVTGQSQQDGKFASSVSAKVHDVSQSMHGTSAHSSSADGDGTGSGAQQQAQNGGNTSTPVQGGVGMTTAAASAIPRAYAGAPAGMHAGPWTAMMAMQEVGYQAFQGKTSIELTLTPANLGKIKVQLKSDAQKNIQVHMVVDQEASRQVIQQHVPALRQALEQHGLNLGQFSMGSQHQQGNTDGSGQQQRSTEAFIEGGNAGSTNPAPLQTPNMQANVYSDSRLSIRI